MRGFLKLAAVLMLAACGGPTEEMTDTPMPSEPSMGEVQAESFDMCLPDGTCPRVGQQCLENRRCIDCEKYPIYCR
jgi:hypothetical protein